MIRGAELTFRAAPKNPIGSKDPNALKIPARRAEFTLTENASFHFTLNRHRRAADLASLAGREEYEVQPGESRTWELKVPGEARFLGVTAGFRDLPNSHWKALLPTPHKHFGTPKVTITVAKSAVSIKVGK